MDAVSRSMHCGGQGFGTARDTRFGIRRCGGGSGGGRVVVVVVMMVVRNWRSVPPEKDCGGWVTATTTSSF